MTEDQKDTLQELMTLLRKVSGSGDLTRVINKAVAAFDQVPTPGSVIEAGVLVKLACGYMSLYMAAELIYHMEEHGGEDCAKDILEYHLGRIRQHTHEMVGDCCDALGITNTLVEPDHNAKVAAEILAECKGDET